MFEDIEKLRASDFKLKLVKLILECDDKMLLNENRPDLDVYTGFVGDTLFEAILHHPDIGTININGKNLP